MGRINVWQQIYSIRKDPCKLFNIPLGCYAKPRIISQDSYGPGGEAELLFVDNVCAALVSQYGTFLSDFWAGDATNPASQFTIDYGCTIEITQFEIRNTNNYMANNVATNAFRLEVSIDNTAWSTAVSGNLMNPFSTDDCEIPLEIFEPQGSVTVQARYVRFQAESSYATMSGLRHFRARYINEGG